MRQCTEKSVRGLSAEELKALLDGNGGGNVLLIDVRQPEEYASGHIPGAILIPLGELEARQGEIDRSKKVVTYCRSGHRSLSAALILCGLGFIDVMDLKEGISKWPYRQLKGMPDQKTIAVKQELSHRDVLMVALKLEKGSLAFYQSAATRVTGEATRFLFNTLASFEERHLKKVYEMAARLVGPGALPPLADLKVSLDAGVMEGGIEVSPALDKIPQSFKDDLDALEIALEKEYLSYDFYQRASVSISDYDARAILHELAVQERGHADIVLNRIAELARG